MDIYVKLSVSWMHIPSNPTHGLDITELSWRSKGDINGPFILLTCLLYEALYCVGMLALLCAFVLLNSALLEGHQNIELPTGHPET